MKINVSFIILSISLMFNWTCLFGQSNLSVDTIKDSLFVKIMNNSQIIAKTQTDYLSIKIHQIDNGSGSAGFESCEVSHNILVAVSEFDEYPKQNLFETGPLFNPKFLQWQGTEMEKVFVIEHGLFNNRKKIFFSVNIDKLIIVE